MSLLHLFSKPKVETAHGCGGRELTITPMPSFGDLGNPLEPPLEGQPHKSYATSIFAGSLRSFKTRRSHPTNTKAKLPYTEPKPLATEERFPHFDPPPLFQAYPQSLKHGTLETPSATIVSSSLSSKSRLAASGRVNALNDLPQQSEREAGDEHRDEAGPAQRQRKKMSAVSNDTTKKVFILVTSGYLLQYADSGPSDRLPEKLLHLGRLSAALPCDDLLGRRFVLQVSGVVDQQGNTVPHPTSFLSKFGIRSIAAKRIVSSFCLILEDSREMESWIAAIRRQVDVARGQTTVTDSETHPPIGVANDCPPGSRLSSRPSHRYLVKRDPEKVSSVSTPATTPGTELESFLSTESAPDGRPTVARHSSHASEAPTIDIIDAEASALTEEKTALPVRRSSRANLLSARSSTIATAITPDAGDPQTEQSLAGGHNPSPTNHDAEAVSIATASIIPLPVSDLETSSPSDPPVDPNRGRSTPLELKLPARALHRHASALNLRLGVSGAVDGLSYPMDSPTIGRFVQPQSTQAGRNSPKRLATAASEPNLLVTAASDVKQKRDSKMPGPEWPHSERERPLSILADLPPSSTWLPTRNTGYSGLVSSLRPNSASPISMEGSGHAWEPPSTMRTQRASGHYAAPARPQLSDPSRQSTLLSTRRQLSFSMPLKVNPSTAHNSGIAPNATRRLSEPFAHRRHSHLPQLRTQTSDSDLTAARRYSQYPASVSSMTPRRPSPGPRRLPSTRPSLYPITSGQFTGQISDTSDIQKLSSSWSPSLAPASGHPSVLRRPASLQVRVDHAPFLSTANGCSPGGFAHSRSHDSATSAVPIRGLRSSRSPNSFAALGFTPREEERSSSAPEAFKDLVFDTPPTVTEDEELSSPINAFTPETPTTVVGNAWAAAAAAAVAQTDSTEPASQISSGRDSRLSNRMSGVKPLVPLQGHEVRPGTAVPFGPPAPPPSAPLPAPPSTSLLSSSRSTPLLSASPSMAKGTTPQQPPMGPYLPASPPTTDNAGTLPSASFPTRPPSRTRITRSASASVLFPPRSAPARYSTVRPIGGPIDLPSPPPSASLPAPPTTPRSQSSSPRRAAARRSSHAGLRSSIGLDGAGPRSAAAGLGIQVL